LIPNMTPDAIACFMLGLSIGALCVAEVVMILFIVAGFRRRGFYTLAVTLIGLNSVMIAGVIYYGTPNWFMDSTVIVASNIGVVFSVAPLAAVIAFGCLNFHRYSVVLTRVPSDARHDRN
jgi:uncharacterized membrane protein YccC